MEITLHKSNKLVKYSIGETISKMSRNHSLCVVDAEEGCKLNYSIAYQAVAGYLTSGNAVVYAAEDIPPEETLNNFSKATNIDAEIYAKNGALTIMKYDALYNSNNNNNKDLDSNNLIKRWQSEIKKKQKKKYKQVLIVDTCKAFTDAGNYHGLVDYEYAKKHALSSSTTTAAAAAAFPSFSYATTTVECVCCFRTSAINRIPSMPILTSILFSHDNKVARAEKEQEPIIMQPLYPSQMQELIKESIDGILGKGTSDLIIKTMKLVYRMEEETVIRRPQLFADTLERIIGENAASTVLINVLNNMKERTIKGKVISL